MQALRQQEQRVHFYKPLISLKAWLIMAVAAAGLLVVLAVQPVSDTGVSGSLLNYQLPAPDLPTVQLPSAALYGIAFIGLILFQLPFIKRLTEVKLPGD